MTTPSDVNAVALLDEPTRRALYEWVAAQPAEVSRDDAASAIGITRALAAFHLDRLARAGLLDTEYRRLRGKSGPGAGRPAKLYRRSAREVEVSLPDRRYGFAAELFARALERTAEGGLDQVAYKAGLQFGREAQGVAGAPKNRMLNVLAHGGYEPVIDGDGVVRLRNCPFHALAASHADVTCGMNLAMAKGMVEGLDDPGLKPELDPQPGWCCVVFRPTAT